MVGSYLWNIFVENVYRIYIVLTYAGYTLRTFYVKQVLFLLTVSNCNFLKVLIYFFRVDSMKMYANTYTCKI